MRIESNGYDGAWRLEFYEEITPLVVAAEYGACDVIKDGSQKAFLFLFLLGVV